MAEDWIGPDWLGGSAIERIVDAPPKRLAPSRPFRPHFRSIPPGLGPFWAPFGQDLKNLIYLKKIKNQARGPRTPLPPRGGQRRYIEWARIEAGRARPLTGALGEGGGRILWRAGGYPHKFHPWISNRERPHKGQPVGLRVHELEALARHGPPRLRRLVAVEAMTRWDGDFCQYRHSKGKALKNSPTYWDWA
jgi:hypothetical protein